MKLNWIVMATVLVVFGGCATDSDDDGDDDFSDLGSLDEKSDAFSYRLKLLGELSYGEHRDDVSYTKTPRFRGFTFKATAGDQVVVNISSDVEGIKPVIWILTDHFKVVARSEDHPTDSNFAGIGPLELTTTGSYYIVFREEEVRPATFSVGLTSPNRTEPFVSPGCPGEWTDGSTAGSTAELDFSTIAGAYTRTAVANLGQFTENWALPNSITFNVGGAFQAQMELSGVQTPLEGTYVADNNFMFGPLVMLTLPVDPIDDRHLFRVLGLAKAPGQPISKLCLAQLKNATGRVFTLQRGP